MKCAVQKSSVWYDDDNDDNIDLIIIMIITLRRNTVSLEYGGGMHLLERKYYLKGEE